MKSIICNSLDCRLQSYLMWEVRVCLVLQRRTCIKNRKENTIIHCLELMINSDMVQSTTFVFILCCHHIDLFWGQRACSEDSYMLDSCDGRIISNNYFYMDFALIKNQCSCFVEPNNNAQYVYSLLTNPGDGCGTGIQIKDSNNVTEILRCRAGLADKVFTNLSTIVLFKRVDPIFDGNYGYCLLVFTNSVLGESDNVTGSCGTSTNATNLASTTTDFSMTTTTSIASHSTGKGTSGPGGFSSTSDLVIIAAGAGSCVLLIIIVAIAIIVKMLRQRQKDNLLKDEVTTDLYAQRKVEQTENTLHQSTDSNDPKTCNSRNAADNRDSGLWVVENTLYKSADEVVDDDNQVNPLDIDSTLYSEINDRDNNETKKLNVVLVYDYAHVPENM